MSPARSRKFPRVLATSVAALLSLASGAWAGSATWLDVGSDWTTDTNWSNSFPNGAMDVATFDAGTNFLSPTITATSITVGQITFTAAAPAYTITLDGAAGSTSLSFADVGVTNGSAVTQNFVAAGNSGSSLLAGFIFANSASAGTNTNWTLNDGGLLEFDDFSKAGSAVVTIQSGGKVIFTDSSDGGTAAFTNNAGGTFDISGRSGSVTIGSINGAGTITLGASTLITGGDGSSGTVSGIITDLGGGGGLTKAGAGTLTLNATNSYNGATTVNGGTLVLDTVNTTNVLASTSTLVGGGGTLRLDGAVGMTNTQVLNGLTVNPGASVIEINNIGATTTLDLRGSSTAAGITHITGGTVDFRTTAGGGTLGSDALVLTGQGNDGTGIIGAWATVNNGAAFATVNTTTGSIEAYGGYTEINALGSTILDSPLANVRISVAGAGGDIVLGSLTTSINTLSQNSGTAATVDTTGGTLRFGTSGGIFITSAGSDLTIGTMPDAGVVTAGGSTDNVAGELTVGNYSANTLTINSTITDNGAGGVSLTKTGSGELILTGTNNYTGATTVGDGTLTLTGSLSSSTALNVAGPTAVFDMSGIATAGQTVGSLAGGTGSSLVLGNKILTAGANGTNTEFAGSISGAGGSLVKTGIGALTLSGNSTYSGGTTLAGGALILNSNTALGTGALNITGTDGDVTLYSTAEGTTLTNAISVTDDFSIGTGAANLTLNGTVSLNGATRTITGFSDKNQIHFGGSITGSAPDVGLTLKTTLGANGTYVAFILDATNANTYTGLTTIDTGAFLVLMGTTTNGAIQGDVLITGNGVLDYLGGVSEQVADDAIVTVNSQGNTIPSGSGSTQFTGLDLYQASGTETIGTLNGTGTVGLASATLSVADGTFTGVISDGFHFIGGGNLVKRGPGTLFLGGANTYTGSTTIAGGTLALIGNGLLGEQTAVNLTGVTSVFDLSGMLSSSDTIGSLAGVTGSSVVLGSRNLTFGGNNTSTTFAGVISGTDGNIVKMGTGTMTLSGANTYTGPTQVNGGILVLSTLMATPVVLNSSSALIVGGGYFRLDGTPGTSRTQVLSGLFGNAGSSVIDINNLGTVTTLDLRGPSGNLKIGGFLGGTIDFRATTGIFGVNALVLTAAENNASGMLGPWATVNGGTAFAMVNADGVIVAYDGYLDIAARGPGSVIPNNPNANVRINLPGTTDPVTLAASVTNINTLTQNINVASIVDTTGSILRVGANGGIFINSGGASLTIGTAVDAGVLTSGGNTDGVAGMLTLGNFSTDPLTVLTVNSTITDNGTGVVSVIKTGSGRVDLMGTNTYTGGTYIGDGRLALMAGGSLADTGSVNLSSPTAIFDISGITTSETIGNLTGFTNSSVVLGSKNLTVNATDSSQFDGVISGTGGTLTKAGTGAWTLFGDNTYTGGTTLENGTLIVNSDTALGTGTLTISAAGGESTLGSNIQGTTINNPVAVTGDFLVGTTQSDFTFGGTVTLTGTRTITGFNSKNQIHFAGAVAGAAAGDGLTLTTTGLGADGQYVAFILDPGNANTYSGVTTIDTGAFLVLEGNISNGAIQGNVVIQGNGVLDYLGTTSEQVKDTATITVNSQGNSASGTRFTGLDLFNADGTETIKTLNGNGTVGLANATLSVQDGNFSGVISDGFHGITGGKLTKRGTGTLTLSGANTYTGATTISDGTLALTGNGSLGDQTSVTLSATTSIFDISGMNAAGDTIASLTSSVASSVVLGTKNLTVGGSNAGTTFSGALSGAGGSFTKTGTGTMILNGANTYTGATTVTGGGVLELQTSTTIPVVLSSDSALVLGGGTLRLRGTNAAVRTQILNGLTVNAGASVIEINNNSGTVTTLDLRGPGPTQSGIQYNGSGTLDFRATSGQLIGISTVAVVLANQNAVNDQTGIIGAWATVNNGAAFATVDGTDKVVAYTGYIDIAARGPGSVIPNTPNANVRINSAGTTGPVTLAAPVTTINTLSQNTGTASTVDLAGGTLRVGAQGGIFITPSGASLTIGAAANNGILTAGGAGVDVGGDLILGNFSGSLLTINSVIANDGEGEVRVTKTGNGVVNLAGTNTYTGVTVIGAGTVALVGAGSLVDTNAVLLTASGAGFDISGIAATGETIGSIDGVGGSSLALGGKNLTTGGNDASTTFAGVISGSGGSLTKVGTGTMILSGENTYTGVTTAGGGLLVLNSTGTAIAGNLVLDGGNVLLQRSSQIADTSTVSITDGILDIGNFSDRVAGVSLVDGSILGSGGTLVSTTTFDVRSGLITANLADVDGTPVGLTKTTDGTVILTGLNSYRGMTTVNGGVLILDGTINGGLNGVTVTTKSEFDVTSNGIVVVGDGINVVTASNGNTINNAGLLQGGNNATGIKADTKNTIRNSGAIIGGAVGFTGIELTNADNVAVNSGFIRGNLGVLAKSSGANTFANLGTLIGDGGVAIDATANTGPMRVINAGAISGDIKFGSGNDEMSIVTKSQVVGIIDGGAGKNALRLIGSEEDTFDMGNTAVRNFSSLYKGGGGTWTLVGNGNYADGTIVDAGQLFVQGNLTSDVLVRTNGFLGGTGIINGNLTNFGIVSPGNSPGKMTVSGNFRQMSGGTLVIQIGGKGASEHDLLVIGGNARLDGRLQIDGMGKPVKLKVGEKITFLTAAAGVSGQFKDVDNTFETNTIVQSKVVYDSTSAALEGVQGSYIEFAERLGMTRNQKAVAHAIDGAIGEGQNKKAVAYLNQQSLRDLPAQLDRVAPEELTAIYRLGVGLANVQTQNVQRRTEDLRLTNRRVTTSFQATGQAPGYSGPLGAAGETGAQDESGKSANPPRPEDQKWGAFLNGMGEWIRIGSTENARGYELDTAGTTVGVDYKVSPNLVVGATAGYTNTGAKLTEDGKISVNGGRVGAYATYYDGGFHADASVSGGYSEYDTQRTALKGTARGKTEGAEFNATLGAGYDWSLEALTLGALTSLEYTYLGFDDFTEEGSLAPLHMPGQHGQSLRSKLGFKAVYDWQIGKVLLRPELRALWQHEYGDRSFALDSQLASGAGGIFTVYDPAVGRDSLLLGVGTSVVWNRRTSTYLYYDGELYRKESESHNISGGLRISF